MSAIEALILGIIQGLTEFLPVSSSGHLELAKIFFQNDSLAEESMLMTVTLHLATACSTIVVFRKDIISIFKGLLAFKWNSETEFVVKIILSMIPAGIVGVIFKNEIEELFKGNVILVASMLIVTAIILLLADKAKKSDKKVGFGHSIIIGISQAIAILPGISRSGATISTSVLLGIDRERAARFSFLMVVPLIFGAIILDVKKGIDLNDFESLNAQERTAIITQNLQEKYSFTINEVSDIKPIILANNPVIKAAIKPIINPIKFVLNKLRYLPKSSFNKTVAFFSSNTLNTSFWNFCFSFR